MSTSATPIQADPRFLVITIFIRYARCLVECYSDLRSAGCDALRPCDASSYTVGDDIMTLERRGMLAVAPCAGNVVLNHHIEVSEESLALVGLSYSSYLLDALHDPPGDSLDSVASISP